MVELSVPSDFMCPISSELMNDPVTLRTGQTYGRRSVEEWFKTGHNTSPSTMQVANRNDFSPNRALQRLIRRWCVSNEYRYGVLVKVPSAMPTVKQAEPQRVKFMLQQVAKGTDCLNNLKQLRSLAKSLENDQKKENVLRHAGAVSVLTNFAFSPENLSKDLQSCEEALATLTFMPLQNVRQVVHIGPRHLTTISWLLNKGSLDARIDAALVLDKLAQDGDEMKSSIGATAGVFEGLVQLLKEDLHSRAVDTALKVVVTLISGQERNTVRAVDAGMVFGVAELLPDAERRGRERPLTKLLELLCLCKEGREAVSAHALVVPMLVRLISVRDVASAESAVSILRTICQSKKCLDEAAGLTGIFSQLSNFIESLDDRIGAQAKRQAAELLRQLRYSTNLQRR